MVEPREVRGLLDDRPDLESAVEAVLDAEAPFAFDDVEVDSGRFGELVDADVVQRTDAGYVVTDRSAVRRGLAGDVSDAGTGHPAPDHAARSVTVPPATVLGALTAAVAFVILLRLVSVPAVFQESAVVLSGNDAYHYRYWVEYLMVDHAGTLASLPPGITTEEPLVVVTLWAVAELVGGTTTAAGWVMAWYPVVSAVATSLLLYLLTVETTADRRIGIAAVAMLAVIPGHAVRTSVGFADHHAFDQPWLVLTALALVLLVDVDVDDRSRRAVLAVLGVGVGIAGQTLAWWAGPLLVLPVGLVVLGLAVHARRRGDSAVRSLAHTLVGLAIAAALVLLVHVGLGWHTRPVALTPTLLLAGSLAVVAAVDGGRRYGLDGRLVLAGTVGAGLVGLAAVAIALPGLRSQAVAGISDQLFLAADIGESRGLFAGSVGWLLWFGLGLALAIPYLVWGTSTMVADARWTVPVAYGWYLLALAAVQIRFVGELAAFTALFAGLGLVHVAERVDLARRPAPFEGSDPIERLTMPNGRQLGALVLLFLLVAGLGAIQTPIQTAKTTTPEEQYRTAAWMADYSAAQGWTYPDNYVFSRWDDNRMYNYFVSGESRSYRFAKREYVAFLGSSDGHEWYERLRDRTGFVVSDRRKASQGDVARALDAYGSRTDAAPGLAHYRAVHVSDEARFRVFVLVPGATLTGRAEPDSVVTVRSERTLDGRTFTYERRARTDPDGRYSVTVAYPGEYTVSGRTVQVPERAVASGETVPVGDEG